MPKIRWFVDVNMTTCLPEGAAKSKRMLRKKASKEATAEYANCAGGWRPWPANYANERESKRRCHLQGMQGITRAHVFRMVSEGNLEHESTLIPADSDER
jgi:hypothetical protein